MPSWLLLLLFAPLFGWGVWRGVRDPSERDMSFWTALIGVGACIFVVIQALMK